MSETPPRRHPNVVNLEESKQDEWLTGSRFGVRSRGLARHAGAKGLGCTWFEVPPGRNAFPYHYHCANEEAMYVLEGTAEVRIGKDVVTVKPGDWVSFPVGPDHAHQVHNPGPGPLRFLGLSTKLPVEVVGYPDSGKVAASALPPGAEWGDTPWLRSIHETAAAVDYWKGEKTDSE